MEKGKLRNNWKQKKLLGAKDGGSLTISYSTMNTNWILITMTQISHGN